MSITQVHIIRTQDGKLSVDVEAPDLACDASHEKLVAVLTLLGAAPVDISESPRAPAQPILQTSHESIKSGE